MEAVPAFEKNILCRTPVFRINRTFSDFLYRVYHCDRCDRCYYEYLWNNGGIFRLSTGEGFAFYETYASPDEKSPPTDSFQMGSVHLFLHSLADYFPAYTVYFQYDMGCHMGYRGGDSDIGRNAFVAE